VLPGLRAIGSAFRQVLTHATASLLANVMATLLSAPIILTVGAVAYGTRSLSLIPLGVALLVGVLPNPCAAGLHAVTREFAASGYATFSDHWAGLRAYFFPALKAWLLSLAVTALIVANLVFYVRALGTGSGIVRSVSPGLLFAWLLVFVVWIAIHLYVFPLIVVQEVKSLRLVYRNAFMMALARPGVTACVVPIWIALLLLCSATGLVTFIGLVLCAAIQHTTTARLLPTFRLRAAS
jgi:uncharacterized membrane protein YesL